MSPQVFALSLLHHIFLLVIRLFLILLSAVYSVFPHSGKTLCLRGPGASRPLGQRSRRGRQATTRCPRDERHAGLGSCAGEDGGEDDDNYAKDGDNESDTKDNSDKRVILMMMIIVMKTETMILLITIKI